MPTLATCIRKAGKALNGGDAQAIREIYDDYLAAEMPAGEAAETAVTEYLGILGDERADITGQIVEAGGEVLGGEDVAYARTRSVEQEIANKLRMDRILDGVDPRVDVEGGNAVLAMAFDRRARRANRGRSLAGRTPRNKEIISTVIADEIESATKREGNAGLWYKENIQNATRIAQLLHEELADPNQQAMFLAGLAITSSETDVPTNAKRAEQVYAQFKKNGRFPVIGWGVSKKVMEGNFEKLNTLLDTIGLEETRKFLATEFTVRNLQDLGFSMGGEQATTRVHGSAIFGPKLGAGFYQNLIGNFEPLTMDRWFMKTWGRIVGDASPDIDSEANVERRAAFREALEGNPAKMAELELVPADLDNDETLINAASRVYSQFSRGNFEDRSPMNNASRNVMNGLEPKILPQSGAERTWIREVISEAKQKLNQRGLDLDTASMQALLWYPEKEIWALHGAGNARAEPTDYETEFRRIAKDRGISGQRIGSALSKRTARRPRGTVPGSATNDRPQSVAESYSPGERQYLLQRSVTHTIRRSGFPSFRASPGTGKGLVGRQLVPARTAANAWERVGVGVQKLAHLNSTPKAVAMFRTASQAAKRAHPDGQLLQTYEPNQLATSQVFLTADKKAGFAIKGGDVVNLFANPNSQSDYQVLPMLSAAVGEGARRYRNFDNEALAPMLAMSGFRPVARIPFDPDIAPEGWDVDQMGSPDFVYYAYDGLNFNDRIEGEGTVVATREEAREMQIEESLSLQVDPGPLSYRWEDETTEDFANERPDNPLAVNSKLGAIMADNAEYAPSTVDQMRLIGKGIKNINDAAIKPTLGAVPTNAIADFMPDERMSAAEDWGAELHAMEGDKAERAQLAEATAKRWNRYIAKNMKNGELLGQVMHAATLAGIDPAERYYPATKKDRDKWTDAEKAEDAKRRGDYAIMKDYWDRLDPEGQAIYKQVRDDYVNFRKQLLESLEQRIDDTDTADTQAKTNLKKTLRKQFEQGRQAVYFPLMRHGDKWAVARDPATNELVAYSKFEKVAERQAWRGEMERLGYETEGGKDPKNLYQHSSQLDPAFAAEVNKLVAGIPGGEQLQDEIHQIWLRQLPEMSVRKQFIHRKGTLGFSTDAMRNYAKYMFHGANQLARLKHQSKMEGHLLTLLEQAQAAEKRDDKHSNWAMPIHNEMIRRHQAAMNPSDSSWANKATALGFGWYLGATAAAAIVNMSQTALVGLPTLGARNIKNGGKGFASVELAKTGLLMSGSMFWGDPATKFRGEERAAFDEASRTGLFEKTQAHDLAALSDTVGNVGSAPRRFMEMISFLFHRTEQWNRHTTYMAAYRLARGNGLSHDAAIKDATEVTWKSHFDYSTSNRPVLLQQDVPKALFLFKNYGLNMTYRMGRDFKTMIKAQEGMDPAEVKEHTQRFAGMMMMTATLGGISSLPLAFLVEYALNAALGDDDEPYDAGNAFKQYLIKDLGLSQEVVSGIVRGPVDSLTGANLSDRVSLSYLAMGREAPGHLEGNDLYHHYLEEMVGPLPGIAGGVFPALEDINKGMPARGFEKVMPKSVRDLAKAWRFFNEGALNYQQQPILSPEAFTNQDLFTQAMGFTPAKLTEQYDQARELRGMKGTLQRRRAHHLHQYSLAYRQKDRVAMKEAWAGIAKWNKAQPQLFIDTDTINASIDNRLENDYRALSGVVLPDNLWYLEERMRWAPKYRKGQAEPVK